MYLTSLELVLKKLFLYVIVDFIYLFLFSFTFSVITFPAPSGYVFPFRKDSIMPHYSCSSLSTLSNSVLYPLLSCFEKLTLFKKWGWQIVHFSWWQLICVVVTHEYYKRIWHMNMNFFLFFFMAFLVFGAIIKYMLDTVVVCYMLLEDRILVSYKYRR